MMTDGRPAPDAAARFYWCSALFGSQRLRSPDQADRGRAYARRPALIAERAFDHIHAVGEKQHHPGAQVFCMAERASADPAAQPGRGSLSR